MNWDTYLSAEFERLDDVITPDGEPMHSAARAVCSAKASKKQEKQKNNYFST